MLLTLFLLSLSPSSTSPLPVAIPTSGNISLPIDIHALLSSDTSSFDCTDTCDYPRRTLLNLVLGCLFTFIAGAYKALHPNIISSRVSTGRLILEKAILTFYMVFFSECIMIWAISQLYGAYRAKQDLLEVDKDFKWTMVHGHYLQMGGFGRASDGHALGGDEVIELLKQQRVDIVSLRISKSELQDHSKADWFSKGTSTLQILWFILQCIIRRIKGLYLTQLEVSTLAFAASSTIAYLAWWDKPFNVRSMVYLNVHDAAPATSTTPNGTSSTMSPQAEEATEAEAELEVTIDAEVPAAVSTRDSVLVFIAEAGAGAKAGLIAIAGTVANAVAKASGIIAKARIILIVILLILLIILPITLIIALVIIWVTLAVVALIYISPICLVVLFIAFVTVNLPPFAVLRRSVLKEVSATSASRLRSIGSLESDLCVGRFDQYSPTKASVRTSDSTSEAEAVGGLWILLCTLCSAVFGSIHFLSWNSVFPTPPYGIIWRASTIYLIAGLPGSAISGFLVFYLGEVDLSGVKWKVIRYLPEVLQIVTMFLTYLAWLAYIFARLAVVVEPFMLLPHLPPGAFVDINWVRLIPHL